MAYRELASNTFDENGTIYEHCSPEYLSTPGTHIVVKGEQIQIAHANRHKIFLNPDRSSPRRPIFAVPGVEIYSGPSSTVYYRGVAAYNLKIPSLYTYNISSALELTEDRTIKSMFDFSFYICTALGACTDADIFDHIFDNDKNSAEAEWIALFPNYVFSGSSSVSISTAVRRIKNNQLVPNHVMSHVRKLNLEALRPEPIPTTTIQQNYLSSALELLTEMGLTPSEYPYKISIRDLENNIMGLADRKTQEVYLSPKAFEMGTKYIASTLYEEYLHLAKGYTDESRALQNHLFETIFTVYENTTGKKLS